MRRGKLTPHMEVRMARGDPAFNLRLPGDLRAWLTRRAKENCRSVNSEMVVRLERSRRAESTEQPALHGEAPAARETRQG